jgi:hypothetical protein
MFGRTKRNVRVVTTENEEPERIGAAQCSQLKLVRCEVGYRAGASATISCLETYPLLSVFRLSYESFR